MYTALYLEARAVRRHSHLRHSSANCLPATESSMPSERGDSGCGRRLRLVVDVEWEQGALRYRPCALQKVADCRQC
jgi:hypothetical protein